MAILFGVIVGGIGAVLGGLWLYGRLTPQHTVLVDNANDFAVEVEVGGTHLTLAPHTSGSIAARDGRLEVKATGPNGFTDAATLELPATGWSAGGRHAIYNVGGASRLAIVTMTYGSVSGNAPPPVAALPPANRLVLLPAGVAGAIDEAFPASVRTKKWGALIQHVCHLDTGVNHIGCPNADG
jgi:hypothetical protein